MQWHEETDFISVGSGAGGLTAALAAASRGADALVLEKDTVLGGVTARSFGQTWLPANFLSSAIGIPDSEEEGLAYMRYVGAGFHDESRLRPLLQAGADAIEFLTSSGALELEVIRDMADYYYPDAPGAKSEGRYLEVVPFAAARLGALRPLTAVSPHGYAYMTTRETIAARGDLASLGAAVADHAERDELCAGTGVSASLLTAAAAAGVGLRPQHAVQRLVVEDGVVTGVVADTPDGPRHIRARAGVLLATGGYDADAALVRSFEHLTDLCSMAPATISGDHLRMGAEVGALPAGKAPASTPIVMGIQIPGRELDGRPMAMGVYACGPGAIFVNSQGERFADETFYHAVDGAYCTFDGRAQQFRNRPAFLVLDGNCRQKSMLGPFAPGEPLPDGLASQADTIHDVATLAGIDPEGLVAAVDRFNALCASGVDTDFGRGERSWSRASFGDATRPAAQFLGPLTQPPFYAIELKPVSLGIPSYGLEVDALGRVVNARGTAIPGLYASGNAAASTDVGAGYQSGYANLRGLAYGYNAALTATGATAKAGV